MMNRILHRKQVSIYDNVDIEIVLVVEQPGQSSDRVLIIVRYLFGHHLLPPPPSSGH